MCALLGAAVIVGWQAGLWTPVRPILGLIPMTIDTAAAFLLCGLTMAATGLAQTASLRARSAEAAKREREAEIAIRAWAEASLRRRALQQQIAAQVLQRALAGLSLDQLADQTAEAVARGLEADCAEVLDLAPGGQALRLQAGVGWREGLVGSATIEAGASSHAGYTLQVSRPVAVEDLAAETRFHPSALLVEHGLRSGLTAPVNGRVGPLGVLGAHARSPRTFTEDDVAFLEALASTLAAATERKRAEDALARLASIVEASDDAILSASSDGAILTWNAGAERMFGYRAAECAGRPMRMLAPPERHAEDGQLLDKARRGESVRQYETVRVRKDGACVDVSLTQSPIRGASGQVAGLALVAHDWSARKRLEGQLRRKNQELQQQCQRVRAANQMKDEFLANVSHELRSPLNGIIGFTELMHDGKLGPVSDQHREYLDDVLTSARHLLQLINDILDLSKVEAGHLESRPEKVAVGKLVHEVTAVLRAVGVQKRIAVMVEVADDVDTVYTDPGQLKQVLYNYLSNALKFTPEDGRVTVRVGGDEPGWFRLEVEDTGIGIAPEQMPQLFVEFQQLDAGRAKKYQGSGLGLALTKRLVEAQGGRVGARSVPGEGSVFYAVLPRDCSAAGALGPEEPAAVCAGGGGTRKPEFLTTAKTRRDEDHGLAKTRRRAGR